MRTSSKTPSTNATLVGLAAATRRVRGRERLSRGDLAKRTGLSIGFITAVEHGTGNPTVMRLFRLAKGLGLDGATGLLTLADEAAERIANATVRAPSSTEPS
jgi:transcriptional regulator with XRE-family HTH domain